MEWQADAEADWVVLIQAIRSQRAIRVFVEVITELPGFPCAVTDLVMARTGILAWLSRVFNQFP